MARRAPGETSARAPLTRRPVSRGRHAERAPSPVWSSGPERHVATRQASFDGATLVVRGNHGRDHLTLAVLASTPIRKTPRTMRRAFIVVVEGPTTSVASRATRTGVERHK